MIFSRCAAILIITCALYGCASNLGILDMVDVLPIHEDGYDVDKRKLGSESNQQLFYRLDDAYPSTGVLSYYKEYFLNHGWRKCEGSMKEWESFVDATKTPERLVHQVIHYWVKEDENKLGIISLRYYSMSQQKKIALDNHVQNVFILMQEGISNLEKELSRLSVDCSVVAK